MIKKLLTMPLDGVSAASGKPSQKNQKRTTRLSSLAEDFCCPVDDAPFRIRLHMLFSQIEKEFEMLYLENLNCKVYIDFKCCVSLCGCVCW